VEIICDYKSTVLKKLKKAILGRDKKLIIEIAKKVANLGFGALEICLPESCEDEAEAVSWAVSTVQEDISINFMVSFRDIGTVRAVLEVHDGPVWFYAVPCDREEMKEVFSLAAGSKAHVVGQILKESGVPDTFEECLSLATDFVVGSGEFGMNISQLFLDPVLLQISAGEDKAGNTLRLIEKLKELEKGEVQTILRLSSLGEGMPSKKRVLIEQTYLAMAMHAGLNAVIFEPYDERLIESVSIVEFFQNKRLSFNRD